MKSFVNILLLMLLIFSLTLIIKSFFLDSYPDFSVYYYATESILQKHNPYQTLNFVPTTFIYPPFALIFFIPFTIFPLIFAQLLFTIISFLAFVLSIILIFKIHNYSVISKSGVLVFSLSFLYFPEKFTLGMGQINNIVFLFFVLFVYFLNRLPRLSGFFLSLSLLLKLFPALIFVFLLTKRKWVVLVVCSVYVFLTTLVLYLIFGFNIFQSYVQSVLPSLILSENAYYYNQALSGFLLRSSLEQFQFYLSVILLLSGFLILQSSEKNICK